MDISKAPAGVERREKEVSEGGSSGFIVLVYFQEPSLKSRKWGLVLALNSGEFLSIPGASVSPYVK